MNVVHVFISVDSSSILSSSHLGFAPPCQRLCASALDGTRSGTGSRGLIPLKVIPKTGPERVTGGNTRIRLRLEGDGFASALRGVSLRAVRSRDVEWVAEVTMCLGGMR